MYTYCDFLPYLHTVHESRCIHIVTFCPTYIQYMNQFDISTSSYLSRFQFCIFLANVHDFLLLRTSKCSWCVETMGFEVSCGRNLPDPTPMMAPIIQWNCRGLKVNFIEITLLVQAFLPVAFCLQETHLKKSDNINLKNYSVYSTYVDEAAQQSSSEITFCIVMLISAQIYRPLLYASL